MGEQESHELLSNLDVNQDVGEYLHGRTVFSDRERPHIYKSRALLEDERTIGDCNVHVSEELIEAGSRGFVRVSMRF
jgi:hypothetical protein